MKPLTGSFELRAWNNQGVGGVAAGTGIVSTTEYANWAIDAGQVTAGNIPRKLTINTSYQMKSYSDDIVVRNRLMRMYKRIA